MVDRLILSYRGGGYAGWQRQTNAVGVQQVVEEALGRLGLAARVVGAGRTDAGVHARAQAAHVEPLDPGAPGLPPAALVHGTNRHLPEDVRVMAAERVADGFHARKHAAGKLYVYRLRRCEVLSPLDAPFVVRVGDPLDLDRLRAGAAEVVGRHDFTAFALAGGSHRQPFRTVTSAEWDEMDGELRFRITGDGFLRGMVRSLVGTLLEVGRGRRSVEDLGVLLTGRPREEAGPTAPAQGLCLERVDYPLRWRPLERHPAG